MLRYVEAVDIPHTFTNVCQATRMEMRDGFNNTGNTVRSQAEVTRKAIHAEGEETRQVVKQVHLFVLPRNIFSMADEV